MLKCAKFACNEISNLYALDISVHNKGTTMQDYYAWTLKTHNCNSCQPFGNVKRNNWVAEDDHSEHCEIKRWARKGKSFSPLVCLWLKYYYCMDIKAQSAENFWQRLSKYTQFEFLFQGKKNVAQLNSDW